MPVPAQPAKSSPQQHAARPAVAQAKHGMSVPPPVRFPSPPPVALAGKRGLAPPPVYYPQRQPVAQGKSGSSAMPQQPAQPQAAVAQSKKPWPAPPPVHFPQRDIAQARSAEAAPGPVRFHQAGAMPSQKPAAARVPHAALNPPPVRFPHPAPIAQAKQPFRQLGVTAALQAKLPNQTCEDDVLAALQGEMHGYCDDERSCAKKNQHCNYYETRVQTNEDCLRLRQQIQDDCFTGHPEAGHEAQIKAVKAVLKICQERVEQYC